MSIAQEKAAAAEAARPERDWQSEPLAELMAHIKSTHHRHTRDEIKWLPALFEEVCFRDGKNHPELLELREVFAGLARELTMHMMKEEAVLFPYIVRMEEAVIAGEPVLPPPFGTVRNPVAMMMREHDGAWEALRAMREASRGYTAPPDVCPSYRTLFGALAALDSDLERHIRLENEILFPRAIGMETRGE